jgi:hypothetical protein
MFIAGSRVRFQQRSRYSLFHGAGEHMYVPRLDVRTTRRELGHTQNFLDDLSRNQQQQRLASRLSSENRFQFQVDYTTEGPFCSP